MKLALALSCAVMLTACAPAYGPPARVAVGVGVEPVGYDGFYDDYYGPFYDGYWGRDNFFYYSRGAGYPYRRDIDHHFRRAYWSGFHPVHGRGLGRR